MSASKKITMYLYTRYERFWHWLQMALIFVLLVTGFEVHGSFPFLGFNQAVDVHNTVGLAWLIAFAFFIFWVFTTGEWKQYIPTTKKMFQVVLYYSYGIFRGESHPVPKRRDAKHNPLQRIVYLSLAAFLLPRADALGFSLLGIQLVERLGAGLAHAGHHRPGPYGRCIRDPVFHHRPRLHDHHRTHRHRPRQGHDHRLGGC
jgi:thiosulfate reductase cytochrome b subunit